ncbi:MAG TPA: HesA/MoeB/ThiF family protein [Mucilaginibacter sp.]|nr:HesA/MoeB/ThiF family protein [Mucilaginibacter sp.]
MNPEFLRYSCQIALPGFDEVSQQKLQDARVLIAGAGGLGCPAAQYLAAAGIGTLGIADFDLVSESNLHRQVLYSPQDSGKKKVTVACERLQRQNPGIKLVQHDIRITSANVMNLVAGYDIIVDGTDNFETRYLLNDAAVLKGIPLVYGAIYQFEGQVAVWNVKNDEGQRSPNYRDLFPIVNASQIPNCTEGGVIPTLAGIIGCIQANEVIKYLTGSGELLSGRIMVFDARSMQSRVIKIRDVTQISILKLTETIIVEQITTEELQEKLKENSIRLVDVRTTAERDQFNIGGEHIPVNELANRLDEFSPDAEVVFYCATGKRSGEAVKLLKTRFPGVRAASLLGGLNAWPA